MDSLSLGFLPLALWWPVATGLSLLLVLGAVLWMFMQDRPSQRRGGSTSPAWLPWAFALLALVWWGFGLALALWPLRELDELGQWARASSYVLVPLWIGGVAWVCALVVQRLLRSTAAMRG
ncbi:hypothetical protein HS961_00980 [Comamonas piscis]|uniref:Uncharacterized protein n=1 Tax=Comamonas piscis TaxID=1562974 RepID=A0A7G5EBZ6_9BURK|nr:hypothetical protein [Comamonas piscis]QMV71521.1 hypothetical protein HS961_00980 [Comamonas piscis]WSO34234.1 hypothetical protein VUJ63_00980 [Comamonas piscis]